MTNESGSGNIFIIIIYSSSAFALQYFFVSSVFSKKKFSPPLVTVFPFLPLSAVRRRRIRTPKLSLTSKNINPLPSSLSEEKSRRCRRGEKRHIHQNTIMLQLLFFFYGTGEKEEKFIARTNDASLSLSWLSRHDFPLNFTKSRLRSSKRRRKRPPTVRRKGAAYGIYVCEKRYLSTKKREEESTPFFPTPPLAASPPSCAPHFSSSSVYSSLFLLLFPITSFVLMSLFSPTASS